MNEHADTKLSVFAKEIFFRIAGEIRIAAVLR